MGRHAGNVTKRKKKEKLYLKNNRCHWCGKVMKFEEATIEHLIPKSKGGTSAFHNLALAHSQCNGQRGTNLWAKPYDKWAEEFDKVKKEVKLQF